MHTLTVADANNVGAGVMAVPGWLQIAVDWAEIGAGILASYAGGGVILPAIIPYVAGSALMYNATHPAAAATITRAYTTGAAI